MKVLSSAGCGEEFYDYQLHTIARIELNVIITRKMTTYGNIREQETQEKSFRNADF